MFRLSKLFCACVLSLHLQFVWANTANDVLAFETYKAIRGDIQKVEKWSNKSIKSILLNGTNAIIFKQKNGQYIVADTVSHKFCTTTTDTNNLFDIWWKVLNAPKKHATLHLKSNNDLFSLLSTMVSEDILSNFESTKCMIKKLAVNYVYIGAIDKDLPSGSPKIALFNDNFTTFSSIRSNNKLEFEQMEQIRRCNFSNLGEITVFSNNLIGTNRNTLLLCAYNEEVFSTCEIMSSKELKEWHQNDEENMVLFERINNVNLNNLTQEKLIDFVIAEIIAIRRNDGQLVQLCKK